MCISNVVLGQELSDKMMNSVNFSCDDSAINAIFEELSPCFKATFAELFFKVQQDNSYELLRNCSKHQFYNPESTHTMEEHSQQTKMDLNVVHVLSVTLDDTIKEVIANKFNGNFLKILKGDVLKIALKLYSDLNSLAQEESISIQPLETTENSEVNPEVKPVDSKTVLEKLTDVKKYLSQNLKEIDKNVIDMSFENTAMVTENAKALVSSIAGENILQINDDSIDLGDLSFDSISSVHTSDLSSFDDEISISSDEEFGNKRKKLSLKLVEEEVNQIRAEKKEVAKDKKRQAKRITQRNLVSEVSTNDTTSIQQKSLPNRIRKPNSKYYNEFDIISPSRRKSTEKSLQVKNSPSVQESETMNSLSRKRGRPRKIMQ